MTSPKTPCPFTDLNRGPTGGGVSSVAGAIINFNGWRIASSAVDITV